MLRGLHARRTCYEDATIMLATFGPSRRVQTVWRVSNNIRNKSSESCSRNLENDTTIGQTGKEDKEGTI